MKCVLEGTWHNAWHRVSAHLVPSTLEEEVSQEARRLSAGLPGLPRGPSTHFCLRTWAHGVPTCSSTRWGGTPHPMDLLLFSGSLTGDQDLTEAPQGWGLLTSSPLSECLQSTSTCLVLCEPLGIQGNKIPYLCQEDLRVRPILPSEGKGGGRHSVGEGKDMNLEPVIAQ